MQKQTQYAITWEEFSEILETSLGILQWTIDDKGTKFWWHSMRRFTPEVFGKAMRWYLERKGPRFQQDFFSDVLRRCKELELSYPAQTIVVDGVAKHHVGTKAGKPLYLTADEIEARQRKALPPPKSNKPLRRIGSRELGELMSIHRKPLKLDKLAAEQIEKLKGSHNGQD